MDEIPRTITKALTALGTVCLLLTVAILLRTPAATGYEISMYGAFPRYFWALLIGTFVFGQLAILSSAIGHEDDHGWIGGVGLMATASLIVVLLPSIRGYPVYGRADTLTHIGMIHDLEPVGIGGNIYPPTHVVTQALAGATGQGPIDVINLVPLVYTVLFFGAISLVVVQLFERRQALFCLPVVLLPIMGTSFVMVIPFLFSILLVPLTVFLLLKEQRTRSVAIRALFTVSVVGVVLYHPLTAMFFLVATVLYSVLGRTSVPSPDWSMIPNVTSLTAVVFGAWYMQHAGIIIRFRNIANDFIGPSSSESELEATAATITETSPALNDLLQIAVLQRGSDVLIYGSAAMMLLIVGLTWYRYGDRPDVFRLLFLVISVVFGLVATVFLTTDLIAGYGRPLLFGKTFAMLFVGVLFYELWAGARTDGERLAVSGTFSVVLFMLAILLVFSMFTSPLVFDRNHQVTEMEIEGSEWLFEERNQDHLIEERGFRQHRYYHMHYGTVDTDPTIRWGGSSPPPHFNYTEYDTLGESYTEDRYVVLTQLSRIEYQERFPDYEDQWKFTPEDFERLETDSSTHRLYDNGEFNVYLVNGTATAPNG